MRDCYHFITTGAYHQGLALCPGYQRHQVTLMHFPTRSIIWKAIKGALHANFSLLALQRLLIKFTAMEKRSPHLPRTLNWRACYFPTMCKINAILPRTLP